MIMTRILRHIMNPRRPKFPELYHGKPEWPSRDDEHLFWVGLHTTFHFAHHPVKGPESMTVGKTFFCRPARVADQLIGVLRRSEGGASILVTGYRGTGKTSLVNNCLAEWFREDATKRESMRVNMATVTCSRDVLLLSYKALIGWIAHPDTEVEIEPKRKLLLELERNSIRLRAVRTTSSTEPPVGLDLQTRTAEGGGMRSDASTQQVFEGEALSEVQAALVNIIRSIRENLKIHLVFVFDEVDKLMPVDGWQDDHPDEVTAEIQNLTSLQQIVGELKYFLSESPSHQIFIAGKDVDDSWAEDQNKGEGIFESIFACNIHVPSIFTLELEPCTVPLPPAIAVGGKTEVDGFYTMLAGQLGIPRNSLVFRTALLILPHLAEYEIVQLLTRAYKREPHLFKTERHKIRSWLAAYAQWTQWNQMNLLNEPGIKMRDASCRLANASECLSRKVAEHVIATQNLTEMDAAIAQIHKLWSPKRHKLKSKRKSLNDTLNQKRQLKTDAESEMTEAKTALTIAIDGADPSDSYSPFFELNPMSERTCRRLRILLEYLTYKGRGIPRKIMREFYGMARPSSCVPDNDPGFRKLLKVKLGEGQTLTEKERKEKTAVEYVLAFPQHHLQKMNFYAAIVEHLDQNFALLRGLNDKGRVAIFHILDYLLKYYGSGFSNRDLEHAPFMTDREEFFPSRQLAVLILRLMDGRLWRRKDSRSAEYRMLHHVGHDLGVMFLRYGPEQMELRHTLRDFREELPHLRHCLANTNAVKAEERLAPIHAQLRMARIMELCGRHYEARLNYYVALRWLRMDVAYFEKSAADTDKAKAEAIQAISGVLAALAQKPRLELASQLAGEMQNLSHRHPVAFATYLVETHLALGRILEEVGELRGALQHYEEAFATCVPYVAERAENRTQKSTPTKQDNEYAESMWKSLCAEARSIKLVGAKIRTVGSLTKLLGRQPPMDPLMLDDVPQNFAHVCNHAATAYSKLWERASADAYLLRALFYLDLIGDEYGLVDQMFFIGQIMVRRRDLPSAAMWYRAALRKVKAIRDFAELGSFPNQTGAKWQTPPILATTEAQIFAALGDVVFATGGFAFHSPGASQDFPKDAKETAQRVWEFITVELGLEAFG
jgi:tetratricopeptide (TPR) repeat protein/Cdc6-like AAA superfamily ATPase